MCSVWSILLNCFYGIVLQLQQSILYALMFYNTLSFQKVEWKVVVSTVVSGILFAHFPTVVCVCKGCSFLLWRHSCSKKVPVEKESFLPLFHQYNAVRAVERVDFSLSFLSSTVSDIRKKLYMVGTYSTVKKRAKRMPDTTVETTKVMKNSSGTVIGFSQDTRSS